MVTFDLAIQLDYELSGPSDFVFNFHPANTPQQRVCDEYLRVTPATPPHIYWMEPAPASGNRILRMCSSAGSLSISYEAIVDVRHHFEPANLRESPIRDLSPAALQYVYPSRYCPSDSLPREVVANFTAMQPGYARVQAICDWVRSEVRFHPGSTHASTSALDTLRDRTGVCRDFAHLMIAICRALNVPARFVTGIDYGADPALGPADFHAYVEAYLDGRWYVFDPSGICQPSGLLRIGTGRDAADVAFATMFGSVRGAAPKIHIQLTAGKADMPANQAVSTAGDLPVAAVLQEIEATGADWTRPAGQHAESDAASCRGLSYKTPSSPTGESAERR